MTNAPHAIARRTTAIRAALMLVVPRDSLAPEGADATIGEDACVSTGFGSATPAALPCRTRDASDVGKAWEAGRTIASEAGPTGAMAVAEAITGATAARALGSTDLSVTATRAHT